MPVFLFLFPVGALLAKCFLFVCSFVCFASIFHPCTFVVLVGCWFPSSTCRHCCVYRLPPLSRSLPLSELGAFQLMPGADFSPDNFLLNVSYGCMIQAWYAIYNVLCCLRVTPREPHSAVGRGDDKRCRSAVTLTHMIPDKTWETRRETRYCYRLIFFFSK